MGKITPVFSVPVSLTSSDRYLRLPAFLNTEDVDALLTRSKQLIDGFSLEDHPLVRSFQHDYLTPLI